MMRILLTLLLGGTPFDRNKIPNNDLDYFAYDTVTHGLIVGINFKF